MTFTTHGGPADSGRKLRRASDAEPKSDWVCTKGHENRGYCTRCLTLGCNESRTFGRPLDQSTPMPPGWIR